MNRPADHLIRKIESLELRNQRQKLLSFLLTAVLPAPVLKPFARLLLRDPERNDTLRHIFRTQIIGPHQTPPAEGAPRERFILLKHHFRAASAAGRTEEPVFLYRVLEFLPLQFPESLFFFLRFADADRTAAVTAHVHLPHYVKICRRSALRAVNPHCGQ